MEGLCTVRPQQLPKSSCENAVPGCSAKLPPSGRVGNGVPEPPLAAIRASWSANHGHPQSSQSAAPLRWLSFSRSKLSAEDETNWACICWRCSTWRRSEIQLGRAFSSLSFELFPLGVSELLVEFGIDFRNGIVDEGVADDSADTLEATRGVFRSSPFSAAGGLMQKPEKVYGGELAMI